jgi:hypothetical protein
MFAGLLVTLCVFAAADVELRDGHPDTYVVVKGDTLWDISARFLKKPWLWPEIWQANPQVQNPHLIYPGDVLNLAYLNGRLRLTGDRGPRIHTSPLDDAIRPIPLREIRPFLQNMRVVSEDEFKRAPHLVAIEENQLRGVNGNLVYVRGANAGVGTQFSIVRPTYVYYSEPSDNDGEPPTVYAKELDTSRGQASMLWRHHPLEHHFGRDTRVLGYEVMVIGQGQITRTGDPSSLLVTYSDMEVRAGDLIMPVEEKPYDFQYVPHAPAQVPVNMRIIAFTDALAVVGPRQVVALSRGSGDGVENGQTYTIYQPGETITDQYLYEEGRAKTFFNPHDKKVTLPEEYIGHVMIFRTFEHVSYGLVMDGIKPVRLQAILRAPE